MLHGCQMTHKVPRQRCLVTCETGEPCFGAPLVQIDTLDAGEYHATRLTPQEQAGYNDFFLSKPAPLLK